MIMTLDIDVIEVLKVKIRKLISIGIIFVIILMGFSACNNTKKPETQAVVVINNESINESELMLYLLQVKRQFEQMGGPEIWDTEDFSGGKTAEQVAKEGALSNLIKNKILVSKASSMGISLSQSEVDQTTNMALQYYDTISTDTIATHNITKQLVIDLFMDINLADKVEETIKNNCEPNEDQINQLMMQDKDYATYKDYKPKEILTMVEVKQIYTKTGELDANKKVVLLSEDEQKIAYDKIKRAYDLANSGEDFDYLISKYSENDAGDSTRELSVVEVNKIFNDLSVGQISEIAQTNIGYYIFKLIKITEPTEEQINDYQQKFRQWEETLRDNSVIKLKQNAFDEFYNEWKNDTIAEVNNDIWDKMSLF